MLVVLALGFLWWLSSQWFVGPSGQYVAIYQGIPQQMAGVPLNRVVTSTALPVATLPYYDQAQLQGTLDAATQAGGAADRHRPGGQVRVVLVRAGPAGAAPRPRPGPGRGRPCPA